tara:strand:- start:288 stop:863 length:576 start_codon:yes stop_codon:yes gene_type:complete
MILQLVESDLQKQLVKKIITKHHSYVPTHRSVGRRIDWLIYEDDKFPSRCIGMIGIGSSVYPPPKDLLNYVGMTKSEYKDNFNSFANNWRYCMTTSIPNAGSQILKQLRYLAPIEWEKKYKNFLTHIITFVGGGNNGAVYRADNWDMVGHTSGLPDHDMISMKWDGKEQLKKKFVKPTGENKKLIFVTQVK